MTTKASNNGETAASVQNAQKKFSPVLHNWKCNVKANRKMQIILTILHMVAAPAALLAAIISIYSNNEIDGAAPYAVIGVITTCVAAFLGIFVAVDSFKCLYSRSVVDMRLSLPLTADQRFTSNFLSGLFTYMVPFLASQVFSVLLAGYGLLFMDGQTFYRYRYYYNEYGSKPTLEPYICDDFSYIMPALLKLILCGTLVMLMLYTMTVLVTVCCGSKFECIAYAIIINAVIPLTILMVTFSMFNNIFGIYPESTALRLFLFTSPAGGIFAAVGWVDDDFLQDLVHPAIWAALHFLVTAAIGVLAFFLYRKRRAEQVSKPFVFKLLYYIILTSGIFCIYSGFFMLGISIIPTIITTAILYMIFEVVTNRGFKKFWLSGIKYAVTMVSAFLLIFTAQKTDGFGALWRVPSASMVTSVEINYGGFYNDFPYGKLILKDSQNIEAVIAAHKNVLDEYRTYRNDTSYDGRYYDNRDRIIVFDRSSLVITYKLAGGGTIERDYPSSYLNPKTIEILSAIDLTDEFRTQMAETYKERILNAKTDFEGTIEYQKKRNRTEYLGYSVYLYNNAISYRDNRSNEISQYYLYNHGFFEQLAEAYTKDIMAINDENYYHSEIAEQYRLEIRNTSSLSVPGSFENTLKLLEEYDFYIPKNEDISDAEIYMNLLTHRTVMFSADEWRESTGIGEGEILRSTYSNYAYFNDTKKNLEGKYYIYDFNKELFDIIRHAQPRNIVGENGYIINVSNTSYVIPAEMQDAAERVAAGRVPFSQTQSDLNDKYLDQLKQIADGASNYYYDYDIYPDTVVWD